MADKNLMSIPLETNVDGSEFVYAVKGGNDVRLSVGDIKEARILTPEAMYPLNGATDVSVNVELIGNPYAALYSSHFREFREFQVDVIGGDFSSPVASGQVDADSWLVTVELLDNSDFKWRCRDKSVVGDYSRWSEIQSFRTLDIYVETPVILSPIDGADFY